MIGGDGGVGRRSGGSARRDSVVRGWIGAGESGIGDSLPAPEAVLLLVLAAVADAHHRFGVNPLRRQGDPQRILRNGWLVMIQQRDAVAFLERRIETYAPRHRHDQAVANDADDPIIDEGGDAPPAAVGRNEPVQHHVAPVRAHHQPDRLVVIFKVIVEVLKQTAAELLVFLPRLALFGLAQRRRDQDAVGIRQIVPDAGITEQVAAGEFGAVVQIAPFNNDTVPGRQAGG